MSAAAWFALLVLALTGWDWVPVQWLQGPAAALPVLALVYVLGIVSDRLADAVFERIWSDDLRGSFFADRGEYYEARRRILTGSEKLSELLEYGRSRLRICRGWAFNLVLTALALNLLLWTRCRGEAFAGRAALAGSGLLLLLALGAWFAWRKLARNEYRKIREQAAFVQGARGDRD